jgi:hypothetical protein
MEKPSEFQEAFFMGMGWVVDIGYWMTLPNHQIKSALQLIAVFKNLSNGIMLE